MYKVYNIVQQLAYRAAGGEASSLKPTPTTRTPVTRHLGIQEPQDGRNIGGQCITTRGSVPDVCARRSDVPNALRLFLLHLNKLRGRSAGLVGGLVLPAK